MKRRAAYAAFEKMVIDLYERKLLTRDLLDYIASQYCLVGIDSAGSQYVLAHDGKDLHQICIELVDPFFPLVARGASEDHEEYWEQELKKWEEIVHKRWSWHAYGAISPIESERNTAV